jgi:hypothetical protein
VRKSSPESVWIVDSSILSSDITDTKCTPSTFSEISMGKAKGLCEIAPIAQTLRAKLGPSTSRRAYSQKTVRLGPPHSQAFRVCANNCFELMQVGTQSIVNWKRSVSRDFVDIEPLCSKLYTGSTRIGAKKSTIYHLSPSSSTCPRSGNF